MLTGVLVVLLAAAAIAQQTTLHVALNGEDSASGSALDPFRTIARAQAAARAAVAQHTQPTIVIHEGTYFLADQKNASSLLFTPEDSGLAGAPTTYTGVGHVVISGGILVTTPWLSNDGKLWSTQLASDAPYLDQLWINGVRQTLARSLVHTYADTTQQFFVARKEDLPPLPEDFSRARVTMYETWTASLHQIKEIDYDNNTVFLKNPFVNNWIATSGNRYYFENLPSLLDEPGEFYFNQTTRVLSWITDGVDPNLATIIYPNTIEILSIQGSADGSSKVSNIVFSNLTFAHAAADFSACYSGFCADQSAAFLTSAAIHFKAADNITLTSVAVQHVGGYGVWMDQGTTASTLWGSHVHDLGAGAVRVGQGGNAPLPMQTIGNTVSDSILEDGGHIFQEGCGVLAQVVSDTTISHNVITNFLYTGVSVGWSWGYMPTDTSKNLVDSNAISKIGQGVLSDMGCVYTLGLQPGSQVLNNICHDVNSFGYGGWAYYTDEGSTGIKYADNIAYDIKCAGHHQHYGMDNLITNNVYANVNAGDCDGVVRNSQHSGHTTDCHHIHQGDDQGQCSSFVLMTNILYVPTGPLLTYTVPYAFMNTTTNHNTYFRVTNSSSISFPTNRSNESWAMWQSEQHDLQGVIADPLFDGGIANQFSKLQPNSPSLSIGFTPIDISHVGPRVTPYGVSDSQLDALIREAVSPRETAIPKVTDKERALYAAAWAERTTYHGPDSHPSLP